MGSVVEEIRRRVEEVRTRVMSRIAEIRSRLGLSSYGSEGIVERTMETVEGIRRRVRERLREVRERFRERFLGGRMGGTTMSASKTIAPETVKQPVLKEEKVTKTIRTAL